MTDSNHGPIENALKAGLSGKAASVYTTLLKEGAPLSPKALILRTRLHRQYVYDALHELETRRLVMHVGEGRKIKYRATSPDRLLQDAEKQRLDALEGVRNLMQLYDRSPAGIVEVLRDKEEIIESEFRLLEEAGQGDFLDIVGGAGMHWVRLFHDRLEDWEALRKKKGIHLRYIGSGEDVLHNREESMIENESRAISGIGNIVNVAIRPESVSFNIYEPEIITVRVRNLEAVASQRALFEVLWGAGK